MKAYVNNNDKEKQDQKDEELMPRAFYSYEMSVVAKHMSFYLSDPIGEPADYIDMIHRIRTANRQDTIYIHLNTPGGRLDTGMQIINAMRSTAAHVVTVLESKAYSMGSLIFLAGDEYQVHDDCLMMFHNFSSGTFGKGNEQHAELNATIKWFNKIIRKYCSPFLNEDEIESMIKGEDIWMDSDEIRKRMNKMFKEAEARTRATDKVIDKGNKGRRKKAEPVATATEEISQVSEETKN